AFVLLGDADTGHEGRVLRVSDADPMLLRAITACGIDVGTSIAVLKHGLEVEGSPVDLPEGAADAVWLTA
ncbi:FeoA family protein, partial [Microbacterium gubbeenense]